MGRLGAHCTLQERRKRKKKGGVMKRSELWGCEIKEASQHAITTCLSLQKEDFFRRNTRKKAEPEQALESSSGDTERCRGRESEMRSRHRKLRERSTKSEKNKNKKHASE